MKIVVILVFTLLYAYCTEASVCFCWSERVISSKKAEIGEVEHAKYASSFCCNSHLNDSDPMVSHTLRKEGDTEYPGCSPDNDSDKDMYKKCCSELWGLKGICS